MGEVFDYVFYAFLDKLPIEFMYCEVVVTAPIGITFYLAVFGLMTRFVGEGELATRMALLEGLSMLLNVVGTAFAAPLYHAVDYYGVYAVNTSLAITATLYATCVLKEYPMWWTQGITIMAC